MALNQIIIVIKEIFIITVYIFITSFI